MDPREICVSKSIGLALWLEGNLPFLLCFTLYLGAISKYKPTGGLYSEGRLNGAFFALRVWEAYIWRGFSEFYGISRKVIGKNVHTTIPKGNVGYDQYAVPDTVAVESSFCHFLLAFAKISLWPLVPFFQISLKNCELKTTHNTFRDGRVFLFPTTFLKIAVYILLSSYGKASSLTLLVFFFTYMTVIIIGCQVQRTFLSHKSKQ